MTQLSFIDAVEAWSGVVCFVGAGGNKTTMHRITEAHPGRVAIHRLPGKWHFVQSKCCNHRCGAGEVIRPLHLARLLTSEQGALKNTAHARVVPVINMVDDARCEALAREAAAQALALTRRLDSVLLTAMKREHPVVAIMQSARAKCAG